jgi:hypothetical protein
MILLQGFPKIDWSYDRRLEKPIQKRIVETKERPAVLERLNATLATAHSTQLLLKPLSDDEGQSKDPMAKYTEEEIKGFAEMVKSQKEWFEDISLKVAQLEPHHDPPASVQDLEARLKMVENEINKTVQKKTPKKKKSADQQPYSAKPTPAESASNQTQEPQSQTEELPSASEPDSASAEDPNPAQETHSKDEL